MIFTSTVFLFLFLPITLLIYYFPLFRLNRNYKNYFLLFASLLFYAWGEPIFIFLMIFSIFITYGLGLLINKQGRFKKYILTMGIIYHISVLLVFKYISFLSKEICLIFGRKSSIDIVLPIGISFFTFQMISYLVDVYREKTDVQKNILYLGLYIAFFPQLIAGPIVRYETIEYEIKNRKENFYDFSKGLQRFILGLGKKALIADYLAMIADNVFNIYKYREISMLTAWLGAIAFTLEIYFDFTGYSDMAIGLGRMFGFHFKENFNYPYIASSIEDFWKRWHISLTDWFRDYVYIPLGGNRVKVIRNILNITCVWILTGIWHGANWTFLLWGVIYCIFQLLEKYVYQVEKWPTFIRHFYTMIIVILCWVIFKADSVLLAINYISCMFNVKTIIDIEDLDLIKNGLITLILSVILSFPIVRCFGNIKNRFLLSFVDIFKYIIYVVILVMTAFISIAGGYSPFIYFNF